MPICRNWRLDNQVFSRNLISAFTGISAIIVQRPMRKIMLIIFWCNFHCISSIKRRLIPHPLRIKVPILVFTIHFIIVFCIHIIIYTILKPRRIGYFFRHIRHIVCLLIADSRLDWLSLLINSDLLIPSKETISCRKCAICFCSCHLNEYTSVIASNRRVTNTLPLGYKLTFILFMSFKHCFDICDITCKDWIQLHGFLNRISCMVNCALIQKFFQFSGSNRGIATA